ncbi:fibrinogen-related protein 3.1 [Elysia marginata]|uniref:Fibrinogen-related protein 3.1 n=1 Tax=Elysia marginata TaxID=1093978 RepID=A0AAV4FHJ8_9GAST|nr:fibrinogen-related protein 3.1 [Elysia marginata]
MGEQNHIIFIHLLVTFLMAKFSAQSQGLEISLERQRIFVDSGTSCAHLTCLAKGNSVSVISVTLSTKVNATGKKNELLTVTTNKPEGDVLLDNVRGNGSLEKQLAFIRLELSERTICESDYFICKAVFVLESGERQVAFTMAGPGEPPDSQDTAQADREGIVQLSESTPSTQKTTNAFVSDLWFLGNKITRVESKFETLRDRLDTKISQNVDAMRKRTGTLENSVLERVASVETDFSARASRLEDRVSSILLSHSPDTGLDVTQTVADFEKKLAAMTSLLATMNETLGKLEKGEQEIERFNICERGMGNNVTKWYPPYVIMAHAGLEKDILCDTQTDGGGWIVFQRRVKGDVDFYRDWTSYREGFGSLTGDFWMGNEAVHKLTDAHPYELRIDVRHKGRELFAEYSSFRITSEADNYRALIGSYTGTFEFDSMAHHNNRPFSTFDRDNDANGNSCAITYHGAWWYGSCHHAHLNGVWGAQAATGASWYTSKSWRHLYFTEMKIRRTEVNKNL